jgi:hypothetical protein
MPRPGECPAGMCVMCARCLWQVQRSDASSAFPQAFASCRVYAGHWLLALWPLAGTSACVSGCSRCCWHAHSQQLVRAGAAMPPVLPAYSLTVLLECFSICACNQLHPCADVRCRLLAPGDNKDLFSECSLKLHCSTQRVSGST